MKQTLYFGFGTQMDYPEWQNGFETSTQKDKVLDPYDYGKKDPFSKKLKKLLEEKYGDKVRIQMTYHDVVVEKGKEIRPVVYSIARDLIAAGWELGDFNKNGAVDDIWEEHLSSKK